MAKKMRGDASMLPLSELNEEIMTNSETSTTPVRPNTAIIVSAATSGERPTASIELTYRYATLVST